MLTRNLCEPHPGTAARPGSNHDSRMALVLHVSNVSVGALPCLACYPQIPMRAAKQLKHQTTYPVPRRDSVALTCPAKDEAMTREEALAVCHVARLLGVCCTRSLSL